jgi:NAD(P)-dependent dehydrogenase (short-subunit alcohol dehydrogenase family)
LGIAGSHVVLIGGSSGIGLATAKAVLAAGASVTIASRSAERLEQAAAQLGPVRTVVADITEEIDVQCLFDDLDRVEHVFVSAGQYAEGTVVDAELETLRYDLGQRLWGPIYVIRHVVPKMKTGSITLLSGQYASRPQAGAALTAAAQAAVETLAKGLALELAPIRVNAVAPGLTDTPMLGEFRDQGAEWARTTLPVGRIGRPDEVAQAVVMLMSNDYVTGEVLHIDGGGRLV